jgi:hypothetical protein
MRGASPAKRYCLTGALIAVIMLMAPVFGGVRAIAVPPLPHISGLSVTSGCVDDRVTITGTGFGSQQGSSTATFNGRPAGILSWGDTRIDATVPYFTATGPVSVTTSGGASNTVAFTVLPRIKGISPGTSAPGGLVIITGTSFGNAQGGSTLSLCGKAPASVKSWSDMKIEAILPSDITSGKVTITTAAGTSAPADLSVATVWYFAEGTTRTGFEEWLCLLNPGNTTAHVRVQYMRASSGVLEKSYNIAARSRFTVSVNYEVGPEQDVSIQVISDVFVVAERPMYFSYRGAWDGGDNVIGATSPSTTWYFAEGTTRTGYEEWLCMQNPNGSAVKVDATYLISGEPPQTRSYNLGPYSRYTVFVNQEVGTEKDVSVNLTAQAPIVAERPMYFLAGGVWAGGHDVVGATAPSDTWYFAEGCTRTGFSQWLCLANPGSDSVDVNIDFVLGTGEVKANPTLRIPGQSRATVSVYAAVGAGQDVSTVVKASGPIVAERPMYFNYSGKWAGGHDVMGATAPAEKFYFAEGYTGAGFEEWMCIFNPSHDKEAQVKITFMMNGGASQEVTQTVGHDSRVTLSVNNTIGPDKEVSAVVESLNGVGVVVERPIYFNYSGKWPGGHDVIGYTP